MECCYCKREISNKGSLKAHEQCCAQNPNRKKHKRGVGAGIQPGNVPWNKGHRNSTRSDYWKNKFPLDKIFVENSTYSRHSLKARILEENLIKYECEFCKIGPIWCGKSMPLLLDHKNGINNDNRLENLRFVCSNCDTQLPTYKARNRRR